MSIENFDRTTVNRSSGTEHMTGQDRTSMEGGSGTQEKLQISDSQRKLQNSQLTNSPHSAHNFEEWLFIQELVECNNLHSNNRVLSTERSTLIYFAPLITKGLVLIKSPRGLHPLIRISNLFVWGI